MDTLSLIATLLRTLANATPGLTSGLSPIAGILDTVLISAAALIEAGEAGSADLQALTSHVQSMVNSHTDPTEADWTLLKARSDAAHALIQTPSTATAAPPSDAPGQSTTTSSPNSPDSLSST